MTRRFAVTALLLCLPGVALAQRGPDGAPAVGDPAPDFELHRLQADGTPSKETVKLSEACTKRPVALVFGSYT